MKKILQLKFKKYQLIAIISILTVVFLITGLVYPGFLKTKGATSQTIFTQTDWSGGADAVSSASLPSDETGWNKVYSLDNIDNSSGSLKIKDSVKEFGDSGKVIDVLGSGFTNEMYATDSNNNIFIAYVNGGIYAGGDGYVVVQKINNNGEVQWSDNGTRVSLDNSNHQNLYTTRTANKIIPDGFGGVIVTWTAWDGNNYIYAQRIDENGNRLWGDNGVLASTPLASVGDSQIVSDGIGGAIVFWEQETILSEYDIYLQKIDSVGDIKWSAGGIPVSNVVSNKGYFTELVEDVRGVSDGAGGIVIIWPDNRNSGVTDWDLYAQRIDSNGNYIWDSSGVLVSNNAGPQASASGLTMDSTGDYAIATWKDESSNIYIQKLDLANNGQRIWENGTGSGDYNGKITFNYTTTYPPQIESDDSGGAYILWGGDASGNSAYVQRIGSDGEKIWGENTGEGAYRLDICGINDDIMLLRMDKVNDGIFFYCTHDGISRATHTQKFNFNGTPNNGYINIVDVGIPISNGEGASLFVVASPAGSSESMVIDDNIAFGSISAQKMGNKGYYPLSQTRWKENGVPVSSSVDGQEWNQITSDDSGDAIITWTDNRSGAGPNIYAQKIDSSGNPQWVIDGVAIATATNYQHEPKIISDGSGGAIISWSDNSSGNSDIYAQRINSAGNILWPANGVAISIAGGDQTPPEIISDGSGGAIITWTDYRNGIDADVYSQRIDATGTVKWAMDGIAISDFIGDQVYPAITPDGSGGAIITWRDNRSGIDTDIYAQRIDATGAVKWATDGNAISTFIGDQTNPAITSDGAGGAIITWGDPRSGTGVDIYVQKIDTTGLVKWATNGVAVSSSDLAYNPRIISDGSGGAVIVWQDDRNGDNDIYAQKIDSMGDTQWATNGNVISQAINYQGDAQLVSDGSGGAIVTWEDYRVNPSYGDIFAQKINSAGVTQWVTGGLAISTASGAQSGPQIASDGSSGAIIAWDGVSDYYSSTGGDIYAQKVGDFGLESSGSLISSIIDTGVQTTWDVVNWSASTPTNTSVGIQTRTSVDNITWSPWSSNYITSGSTITSPIGQYIQYKATLSSTDPLVTPTLTSVSISSSTSPLDSSSYPISSLTPGTPVSNPSNSITVTPDADFLNFANNHIPSFSNLILTKTPPPTSNFQFLDDVTMLGTYSVSLDNNTSPINLSPYSLTIKFVLPGYVTTTDKLKVCQDVNHDGLFSCPNAPDGAFVDDSHNIIDIYSDIATNTTYIEFYTYSLSDFLVGYLNNIPTPPSATTYPTTPTTPITNPVTPVEPTTPVTPTITAGDSLEIVQLSPIPPFNPEWGQNYPSGRVNWALAHRANIYQAYLDILGRRPTAIEVNWWLQYSDDIGLIRYLFLTSEEYLNKH